ncbi:hypothetical protein [Sphingobium sp.]|nr:hypothetical protein [Sphingobium sp.]HUD92596.1 hypothetical protein [Sphingobium sp.]
MQKIATLALAGAMLMFQTPSIAQTPPPPPAEAKMQAAAYVMAAGKSDL